MEAPPIISRKRPREAHNKISREAMASIKQALTLQLTEKIRQEEHARIQSQMQEKYKEKMICMFCRGTLDLPVKICVNGHYACASCYKAWSDREKFEITYDSNFLPVVKASRDSDTYLQCPLKCGVSSISKLKTPADCLVYDLVDDGGMRLCSFPGCSEQHSGRSMCEHFFSCAKQTTNCAACAMSIPIALYKHHVHHDCIELSCRLCYSNDMDSVLSPTYSFQDLRTHIKFHKKATEFREKVFGLLDDLKLVMGNRFRTGEMFIPDNNSCHVDGSDFTDTIHLAAVLKQFVDGRRGNAERLSQCLEVPRSMIKNLL
jgi:hypothetical protein